MEDEDLDVLYKEIDNKDITFSMRYTLDEFKANMEKEDYRAEMEGWLEQQGMAVKKKEDSEPIVEVEDTESVSTGEEPPILSESTETVVEGDGVTEGEVTTEEVTEEEIPTDYQWSTGEEEPVAELTADGSSFTTAQVEQAETINPLEPDKPFSFADPETWGDYKDIVIEENLMPSEDLGPKKIIDEERLQHYNPKFQAKVKQAKVLYDKEMERRKEETKKIQEEEKTERAAKEKVNEYYKRNDAELHSNIEALTVADIKKDEEVLVKELNDKFGAKGIIFEETGIGDALWVVSQDGKFETTIDLQAFTEAGNLEGLTDLQDFIRTHAISNPEENDKPVSRVEQEAIDFYADRNLNYKTIQKAQNDLSDTKAKMNLIEKIQAGDGGIDTYSAKDVKMFPELFLDAAVGGKGIVAVPRNDLQEIYNGLVEDEEALDDLVGLNLINDDIKVAAEEFDELAYKRRQELKEKFAAQNKIATNQMNTVNEECINYFGKPMMEITQEDVTTTEDLIKLKELDVMYEDGRFMQKQASELWLDEQTFLSLQQNKHIAGAYEDNWQGVGNEIAKGFNQGQACQEILSIAMGVNLRDPENLKKSAEDIVHAMTEQKTYGTSRVMQRFAEAEGVGGVMSVFAKDPFELVGSLAGNSLSAMMPYGLWITGGSAAVGAGTGAAIGATGFLAGPTGIVTTGGGALAGGIQGARIGMAATMFAMEYTNSILDVMREKGCDIMNPESVAEYLARDDVWAEGGERGIKRGIPIAVVDYLSAGLAGKAFGATTSVTTSTTRRIGAIVGEQMIFGTGSEMLGEATAMFVAGQNLDAKEILAEGLGALGNNSANLAVNVYQKVNQTAKIEYAEELTNINNVMKETGNLDKVSDWAVRMQETGQIDDVTEQKIQENIGIRRDVDKMVNLSVAEKIVGKVDTRRNEGKIKERLAKLKAAERKYETSKDEFGPQLSAIKKEMNEILTTGKLPDTPLPLPREEITYKLQNKKGKMETVSKKQMEHFLETATPQELYDRRIQMDNAPQHMLDKAKFATDKIDYDAIQKSSTESVDVREQTADGEAVGKGDTKGVSPEAETQEDIAISDQETQEVQPGQEVQSEVGHKVQYGFQDGQYFKIVDGTRENITKRTYNLETKRMGEMGADISVDENGMTTEIQTSEGSGGQRTKLEAIGKEVLEGDKSKDTYDVEIQALEDKKKTILDEGTEIVEDAEIREPTEVTDETVIVEPTAPETRVNPEAQAEADKIDAQIKDLQTQRDAVVETETETETETDKEVLADTKYNKMIAEETEVETDTKDEVVYHGSPTQVEGGKLKRVAGEPIFLTPSKEYANIYAGTEGKGSVSTTTITEEKKSKLFDARNPEHLKKLKEGFLNNNEDLEIEYESEKDALRDYNYALESIKEASKDRDGVADWATAGQYLEMMENAGFEGAIFSERPGVDSYALFDSEIDVASPTTETETEVEVEAEAEVKEVAEPTKPNKDDVADFRKDGTVKESVLSYIADKQINKKSLTKFEKEVLADNKEEIVSLKIQLQEQTDTKAEAKELKKDLGITDESSINMRTKSENPAIRNEAEMERITNEINKKGAKTPNVAVQVVEETDIAKPDTKEMSERVGEEVKEVGLDIIKGIPVVFNISDQLTVGNVTNPNTGREIKNLSGGLLYGYTEEGKGKAWASIDEKTAQDKVNEAQDLYDANKEVFQKWWAENPEYEGVVPMAIVKMGEDAMNSNEAVFRVLSDNLQDIDQKKKDKAMKALPTRLKKLIKDNLKAANNKSSTKISRDVAAKKAAALTKALESMEKEGITDLDQFLTTWLPKQATPLRAVMLEEFTVGKPRVAGQELTGANVTSTSSPVIKALVGWTNKKSQADMANDIALLDRGKITDLITEPGLKDVPQRSMVSIQGVNVNDKEYKKKNGEIGLKDAGVSKGTHSNYKGAINGINIGVLGQPEQVHNIFPKLFAESVSGLQAAEEKGQTKGYPTVSKTEAKTKQGKAEGKKEGDIKPMSMAKNLANKLVVQLGLNKFKVKGDLQYSSEKGKGKKNVTKEGHVSTGEVLNNVNKLAAWLNKSFPSVKVNITPETFETVVNHPDVRTKTKDGVTIYGITKDGDIYINPEAHNSNSDISNTLIHEYGHIMLDYLATTKEGKQKLDAGLKLAEQNTDVFNAQLKKFDGDKQKAANETLAIMIGDKGETITNAAIKSEFQEWLIGMWEYIKDAYSSLKGMSVEEVQNLTLDEFVGAAVRDLMAGKDMKLTAIQEQKLKNPEVAFREGMSVSDIINQARAQQYSDASIREVLKDQFPDMSMAEIRTAMAVQPELFSIDVPTSFGNVEGGMSEGVQMFTRIQEGLRNYAAQEQRTPQQMRAKALALLKADETYKNERGNTTLQKEMQIELDSALNITQEGRTLNRRIAELKSQVRQRKIGQGELKKVQAKLKSIIREALPTTNYSAAQIQRAINIVTKATPDTLHKKIEEVAALVEKKQTEMKAAEINAWTKLATKLGKKVTDAASKVKSNLRVDAKGQQFFDAASKVLKAATKVKPEERAKALAQIGKKLFVTNNIKTKDANGNTVNEEVQMIGTLNPEMESIMQKYNNDEVLTTKEQSLFNLLANYDNLSDIVNKDLEEVRNILNQLSDEQGKSAADLAANRLATAEKNRQIQEEATKNVENSFGSLVFSVDPRTGKPEYKMQNLTRAEKAKFEAAVVEKAKSYEQALLNDEDIGVELILPDDVSKPVKFMVEHDGKKFEVTYIPAKTDPKTKKPLANAQPKYKVKVMKRALAGENELRRRFPSLQDVRNATKLGKWVKGKYSKFIENPTSFFNVMSWGQNLGTMTRMLDETGNFFEKNVYEKLNRMTENALSGLFSQRDFMDTLANKVKVNGKKNKKGIKGIQNDKNVKAIHDITLDYKGDIKQDFTGSQLMRIYALSKNPTQRKKLMENNQLKFTEKSFIEIEAALGEDVLNFVDSVVDHLSNAYFESVNDVYKNVNNVSMNYVENYFPTRTDTGVAPDSDLIQEGDFQTVFSAQYASALKERTDTQGEVKTDYGFFSELDNHYEQMENFKAMAGGVKELNALFQADGVKKALEAMGSEKYMRQLLNVTINPNSFIPEVSSRVEKFFSNFTQYVLGFKLAQIVKQGSSFMTAYEDYKFSSKKEKGITNNAVVDVMGFMYDTILNMANPVQLYKNYQQAKKMSATFRHRMENQDVYALESGRGTRKGGLSRWRKMSAFPTILGDAIGVMGYMINYRRDIANGMSPEAAAEKFNAYNETQQTRRTQDLTPLQAKKNFIYRGFLTFGSTSILQMNKVMVGARNIIIKSIKEKKAPRDKDIRALAINLGLANATFIFASNFMRWGFGDPGDREEIEEEMLKGLWGAKMVGTAVPIAGALFEEMYDVMTGNENPYDKSPLNPLGEMYKKLNRSYNDPDSDKAVIEMSRQLLGMFTGLNTDPFVGAYDLVKDFGGMDSEGWEHDVKDLSTTLGVSKSYQPAMMDLNNFLRFKDYETWKETQILEEVLKELMEQETIEAEEGKREAEAEVLKDLEKSAGRTDYYQSLYTDEGISWGKRTEDIDVKEPTRLQEKVEEGRKKKPWYSKFFGD